MPLDDPISESERVRALDRQSEVLQRGTALRRRRIAIRSGAAIATLALVVLIPLGLSRSQPGTVHVMTTDTRPSTTTTVPGTTRLRGAKHTTGTTVASPSNVTSTAPPSTAVAGPTCDLAQLFAATEAKEGFSASDPFYSDPSHPAIMSGASCAGGWAYGSPDRPNVGYTDASTLYHWVGGRWVEVTPVEPPECPNFLIEAGLPFDLLTAFERNGLQPVDLFQTRTCVTPVPDMVAVQVGTGPYRFRIPLGWAEHPLTGPPDGIRTASFTQPGSSGRIDYLLDGTQTHLRAVWPSGNNKADLTKALSLDAGCAVTAAEPVSATFDLPPASLDTALAVGFTCAPRSDGLESYGVLYAPRSEHGIYVLRTTMSPTLRGSVPEVLMGWPPSRWTAG
jgi:hypothetical protein